MTRNRIWIGIGAFALGMMGTVNVDPSNAGIALSNLSIGGAPALARDRGGGLEIPNILESLEDLEDLEDLGDDGPDDGPDNDDEDDDDASAKGKRR